MAARHLPKEQTVPLAALAVVLLLAGLLVCGCRSETKQQEYQTLTPDAGRDVERAGLENSRALPLMRQGQWEEAEKALKAALAADTMCGPAHNNLGSVYYHQGRYYLAAWEFQYAIKLMPNQPAPRNNLGLVYETAGQLDEAAEHYERAVELDPDSCEYLGNWARARVRRGEKDERVRDLLQKLIVRETRPQWSAWARERLARMGPAAPTTGELLPLPSAGPDPTPQ
jgi:Flp pilus assembly protein TadD